LQLGSTSSRFRVGQFSDADTTYMSVINGTSLFKNNVDITTGNLTVSGTTTATRFISTQTTGTSPFTVASTTLVTNLNADLLDGQHGSYYAPASSIPTVFNNTITLSAGNGLTNGGSFTTNQGSTSTITFNVGAGTGISVAADTVAIAATYSPNTATSLGGSLDLNNYQTAGFWYQTANANAASGSNYPEDKAGSLFIQKAAGVTQQYTTYNDGSPEMWFRGFYLSSWSSWRKVLTDVNYSALLDGRYLLNTTDTFTGVLTLNNPSTNTYLVSGGITQRVIMGGGNTLSTGSGAIFQIQGKDYGGTGLGGNIVMSFATGKGLQCNGTFFSSSDVQVAGAYTRNAHNTGYLEGSYNNVGANGAQSNPIYIIGSSYQPSTTTLSNMYGIGYSQGSATFLNSTDLGTTPASAWGMYVAADGNARIWLNAGSGITRQLGVAYASNFTLNSDKRRKKKIKKYKPKDLGIKWKNFELKTEPGQYRVGVIAQELLETAPELVNQEDPENYTVNSIDVLNAAMAWKDKQIDELTARVEKLELLIKKLT